MKRLYCLIFPSVRNFLLLRFSKVLLLSLFLICIGPYCRCQVNTLPKGKRQFINGATPISISDVGFQVAAKTDSQGVKNVVLYESQIISSVSGTTLTDFSIEPSGNYSSSDITYFKLWASTLSTFDSTSNYTLKLYTFNNTNGSGVVQHFYPYLSLTSGTVYLYITADIANGALPGNNIFINKLTSSNFTFTNGYTASVTSSDGGLQTFQGNYYWNGSGTAALNGTWDNTSVNWNTAYTTGTTTTWPNSGSGTIVANFVSASSPSTVVIPETISVMPTQVNIGNSNYTFSTSGSVEGKMTAPISLKNSSTLTLQPVSTAELVLDSVVCGTVSTSPILALAGSTASTTDTIKVGLATSSFIDGNITIKVLTSGSAPNGATGFVSEGSGVNIASNIINNSNLPLLLGATGGNDLTVSGDIEAGMSSAGLVLSPESYVNGIGTVTLSGVNTYSGPTIFNGSAKGIVRLGADHSFPSSTTLSLAYSAGKGGILDLYGATTLVANVTFGPGTSSITNISGNPATLTINGNSDGSISNVRDSVSSIALDLIGSHKITMGGTNTYSGGTTISGGNLYMAGGSTMATGTTIQVHSDATLSGVGSVDAVNLLGTISPADAGSIGTLNTGALTLGAGGIYYVDINNVTGNGGSNWDSIAVGNLVDATTASKPFIISLNGSIAGFSSTTTYSWVIGSYTGSIPNPTPSISFTCTGTLSTYSSRMSVSFDNNKITVTFNVPPIISNKTIDTSYFGCSNTFLMTVSNNSIPTTFSVTFPAQHTGLTFSPGSNEFIIDASTPVGTYSILISATSSYGTSSITLTYHVLAVSANATSSTNVSICSGSTLNPITYSLSGSDYSRSFVSGLPAGLNPVFNSNNTNLTISGTSTVTGTYNYTVNLIPSCGGTSVAAATGTITIFPTNTPSLVISASATSIATGTRVTFTAYPTYGGTSPTYSWYKYPANLLQNGSSNTYISNSLSNSDYIYCTLNSSDICTTSPTATSAGVTMNVSQQSIHIYNFSPHIAAKGSKIIINGTGFQTSAITQVLIGGASASSFIVKNDTLIEAVVGLALPSNDVISVSNANASDMVAGFVLSSTTASNYPIGVIQNFAGTGSAGYSGDGGPALNATYYHPTSVRMDSGCTRLLISDTYNNVEREVYDIAAGSVAPATGHKQVLRITTPTSGTKPPPNSTPPPNGNGGSAIVPAPPKAGNFLPAGFSLYVTATNDNRVLGVDNNDKYYIEAGSKTGVAGYSGDNGIDSLALFNHPAGIVSDKHSPILYVADELNNRIRRIDLTTHIVTTYAGNGTAGFAGDGGFATSAELNRPHSVDIDDDGNLYIADTYNNRIRKVDKNGIINTIVGTGVAGYTDLTASGPTTNLNHPMDVSSCPKGYLFIADTYNNRIRALAGDGKVYTLSGLDNDTTHGYKGDGVESNLGQMDMPTGVTWDTSGGGLTIYVADANNNMVRSITFGNLIPNNIWTGAVSKDWQDAGNWSNVVLPTTTGTVTIPPGLANNPKLTSSTIIDTLILQGSLDLNGKLLTLNGQVSGPGKFVCNNPASFTINGNVGTLYFDVVNNGLLNLTVNGNVGLGNDLSVYGLLSINSGTLNTNDMLTLKSSSIDSSATVGNVMGSIVGKVTVERFVPQGNREFRDLGAGVANAGSVFSNWQENGGYGTPYGITITGALGASTGFSSLNGLDYTMTGNHSMYTFIDGNWDSVQNTKTTNLDAYQAYRALIRGNRAVNLFQSPQPINMLTPSILRAKGNLVTGTVTYSTSGISGVYPSTYHLTSGDSAFTFLANPYVSPIDWAQIWGDATNISPSFYYADPTFLQNGYLTYVTYNGMMHTSSNPQGSGLNQYIQAGQGFFIQNGVGTPSLVIKEVHKAIGTQHTKIFGTANALNCISVGLNKGAYNVDGAVAAFSTLASLKLGNDDSYKFDNPSENVSFLQGGADLSIDGLPLPVGGQMLQLHLYGLNANHTYALRLDASKFVSASVVPYLVDRVLGTHTMIAGDSTIVPFTTTRDTSSYATRFSIVFQSTVLPVEQLAVKLGLDGHGVEVTWTVTKTSGLIGFVVERSWNGRDFEVVDSIGGTSFKVVDQKPLDGQIFYRVRARYVDGSWLYSDVGSIHLGATVAVLGVYPNPIDGGSFMLHVGSLAKGVYTVRIVNSVGDLVFSKKISHGGGDGDYRVDIEGVATGSYSVVLKGGSVSLRKSIIVH